MIYFKYLFPWPFGVDPSRWPPKSFVETPLPVLVVMFFLAGVLSILLGLMADMMMRTYYESQAKPTYLLRQGATLEGAPTRARVYRRLARRPRPCPDPPRRLASAPAPWSGSPHKRPARSRPRQAAAAGNAIIATAPPGCPVSRNNSKLIASEAPSAPKGSGIAVLKRTIGTINR